MMLRRQRGALLLLVALLLATLAALAFGLNRAASGELQSVRDDYDGRAAGYLAEAGFAAAKWRTQVKGCPKNKVSDETGEVLLGNGSFKANAVGEGEKLTIAASGAVARGGGQADALRTAAGSRIAVHDFTDLETDNDAMDDALDTTIDPLRPASSNATTLALVSNASHALLYWSVSDIGKEDKVLSATLTLTLTAGSPGARRVALHRVTTRWDSYATWNWARGLTPWSAGGGDYSKAELVTTIAAGSTGASWDVTPLVASWLSGGPASNMGVLLRLVDNGQALNFYSRKANSSSVRPVLRVVVAAKC